MPHIFRSRLGAIFFLTLYVLVTGGQCSKSDLVIVNRTDKKIALMELTCLHFNSADKAHQKKL